MHGREAHSIRQRPRCRMATAAALVVVAVASVEDAAAQPAPAAERGGSRGPAIMTRGDPADVAGTVSADTDFEILVDREGGLRAKQNSELLVGGTGSERAQRETCAGAWAGLDRAYVVATDRQSGIVRCRASLEPIRGMRRRFSQQRNERDLS